MWAENIIKRCILYIQWFVRKHWFINGFRYFSKGIFPRVRLGALRRPRLQWGRALQLGWARGAGAAARIDLGCCRLRNCTFEKLPLGKIPLGSCHLGNCLLGNCLLGKIHWESIPNIITNNIIVTCSWKYFNFFQERWKLKRVQYFPLVPSLEQTPSVEGWRRFYWNAYF